MTCELESKPESSDSSLKKSVAFCNAAFAPPLRIVVHSVYHLCLQSNLLKMAEVDFQRFSQHIAGVKRNVTPPSHPHCAGEMNQPETGPFNSQLYGSSPSGLPFIATLKWRSLLLLKEGQCFWPLHCKRGKPQNKMKS